ncbi:MAG: YdjY domain-containing protein [Actinomycetota bacterium]
MTRCGVGVWLIGLLTCAAACLLPRVGGAAPPEGELPAEAEKIGEGLYRIGKAKVDLNTRMLTCAGKVNMQRGTIEYLAVAPEGKLHESVLMLDVRPLHLQVGLILLGLEPKGGLRHQGDVQIPKGSPVEAFVSWKRNGRPVKARAEELVWDVERKRPMPQGAWVFSGSIVDSKGFVADRELSLMATYRDPAAIVNNALPTGSDDSIYKVNERIVPKWDTPVTMTFTPAAKPL